MAKNSKYTRIHRLLKVLNLIQSGHKTTPSELAAECEVEERTIYRDLNELEGAGFPVHFDRAEGRYKVKSGSFLPPVQLTIEESLALAALCEHIAEPEQIPFTRPAWDGLSKVLAAIPPNLQEELSEARKQIVIKTASTVPQDGHRDIYEHMQLAIAEGTTLVCRYDSLNADAGPGEDFDFEPYTLFFSVRAWYAIGFHHGRGELRCLKLSRFSKVVHTARPYTIPHDFSLDNYLGNAWRMIRGDDERVEVRFNASFAETVSETVWHKTQEVVYNDDGSVTLLFTVAGFDEIVWWVLSMGPNCEVIRPAALRERVKSLAAETAALYAGGFTPASD